MALILLCSRSWSCSSQWDRGPALKARQETCLGLGAWRCSLRGAEGLLHLLRKLEEAVSPLRDSARPPHSASWRPPCGRSRSRAARRRDLPLACALETRRALLPLFPDFQILLFSAGAERGRRAGEGRSEGRGRQGIGREVRILTSSSSASSARPVYSVSRSPHFGTSLLFLRTPSSLIFVPFLPHLPRRGARSEGGDECRAYVLPGHEVPLHCPGL